MRNVAISAGILAFIALSLSACGSPMGPIPGGKLDGEVKPWPSDWSFTDDIENVLVETNPEDPYSVTVWGVYVDDKFYIAGADEDSRWVANLMKYTHMRLSVSGDLYEGRAIAISDHDELHEVLNAYVAKYDMEVSEGNNFIEDGGVLFRLSPR
ncbi:MAG: hypothetical protein RIC89_02640 [Pseudomonadales bacterium]